MADYSDTVIPAYPKVQAKGNLIINHRLGEAWLHFSYAGKQFIDFANTDSIAVEPFTLVSVGSRLVLPAAGSVQSTLTLRVNNLFDELYETFGYTYYDGWPPYRVDAYWPGATRSYFVELQVQL